MQTKYWPCFERSLKAQTPILEFDILSWMKSKVANVVASLQYPGLKYFESYQGICLHFQEIESQFQVILTERVCVDALNIRMISHDPHPHGQH